ncbi:MAG: GAF domain-containing sensor histidine kinase [Anaerolineales bacterium]|nr:GAF domain-containing sensor histidine kinase [Anaerolineales bacterium]MCX7754461.1 GAF domain-containing sensor histidine kinase [Anaerolineales bacterium]MDW8276575.1 GAF domain-containing sensor histidine kinase [Anaerolineales bacterium]
MLLTRQQLEERLVALHQASLQLVEDISLETLLERIATVACEQAQARYAALGVLGEDGQLKQFISVGMTEEEIRRIPHPPRGLGLLRALMDTPYPIRLPDIRQDARSVGFPPNHPPMHSFLGVPIRLGEDQYGQIYLTEKIGAPEFTADDERIIQMLAAYAAVAIHNARLYEELHERDQALTRRNQDLALLNSIAKALTSSLKLDEILQKTLSLVMEYMQVESGEIFLLEEDQRTLRLVLHRGQAAEAFWTRNRFTVGEGLVGLVAQTGEPMVSHDLANDVRYLRDAVVKAGFRQMACFPLTSSGQLVGVLSAVTRSASPLDDHDIQVITAIGSWAGLAIENARLHSNARRLAVLEERDRIGMDLHDGIIQSIYGVGLVLEHARLLTTEDPQKAQERIQQAIDSLNHTIRDIRSYILDLRPRQFGDENLLDALKRLVMEFRANTLSDATLTGDSKDIENLPRTQALALFHICQEALANAAKHAQAKKVQIRVWATPERLLLEVRDDGRGFDMSKMSMTLGHGLSNMHTRAQQVGGDVEICSVIGEGTSILAWVPRGQ